MNLVRFTPQRGARAILAGHLDFNFSRLTPINPGGDSPDYKVVETPNGWYLLLRDPLPPRPTEGTYVLGSIDGVVQWIGTESCDA